MRGNKLYAEKGGLATFCYKKVPVPLFPKHPDPGKIIDFLGSKMKPDRYQNDTCIGSKMKLSLVSKRYPNNNNLNNINLTTTKEGKDAVAVVNFKKLKEKGEERMRAIRERMVELDFKEEFIEKILKEYPTKKIDEKYSKPFRLAESRLKE